MTYTSSRKLLEFHVIIFSVDTFKYFKKYLPMYRTMSVDVTFFIFQYYSNILIVYQ